MIAAALDRDSGADRLAGFADALGDRLRRPHSSSAFRCTRTPRGGEGMRALLERAPTIDGVFAASDAVAAGAMEALRAAGRRVPEDVGIVGFDDSAWARRTAAAAVDRAPARRRAGSRRPPSWCSGSCVATPRRVTSCSHAEIVWRQSA